MGEEASWGNADVRYADSGGVHIAYTAFGKGPPDLLLSPAGIGPLDVAMPVVRDQYARLAEFGRFILFAPRGGGQSDPVPPNVQPTIDDRMDDIRAVLDAIGSARAAIIGQGHGGPTAIVFAATYPERVSALILISTYSRWRRAPDYPAGMPDEVCVSFKADVETVWGTGGSITGFLPDRGADEEAKRVWARGERLGASPQQISAMMDIWMDTDVRDILPAVKVPTLVTHRRDERQFRVGHGKYLASHIPGARYVEFAGADHFWAGAALDQLTGEIEEFITGGRKERPSDRVLATVMFTDIVGSTAKATEIRDRAWRELLDRHDEVVRRQLERHRGVAVKDTGDGVAATFDGPARAITCACAIRDAVRPLGLEVRAGLHTGEIERRGNDVSGVGVHIAARVSALAGAGEVLVSSTVKDLVVGSGLRFEDRGMHALKGVPDQWRLLSVVG